MINVRDCGATGDGITDDTAAIQAALNVGGHVVIPHTKAKYVISDVLLISSGTWLEVDPNTTIYEADGNNVSLLRNANLAVTPLDHDIRVTGGIWDNNWDGNPGIDRFATGQFFLKSSKASPVRGASGTLGFYGVTRLILEDITVVNPNHFGIQVAVCHDWSACRIRFTRDRPTVSDGIHVNGPSSRFTIRDVSGATEDDFIALNPWDWSDSCPDETAGDITDGTIEVLRPAPCAWAIVKMNTGTNAGVYNVSIRDVKGTSINGPFEWGHMTPDQLNPAHVSGSGAIGGITLRDVAVASEANPTTFGIQFGAALTIVCDAQDIVIDGVVIDAAHQLFNMPWVTVEPGHSVRSLSVTHMRATDPKLSCLFAFAGTVDRFALTDSDFQTTGNDAGAQQQPLIRLAGGSAVKLIQISDVRLHRYAGLLEQVPGAGSTQVLVANSQFDAIENVFQIGGTADLALAGAHFSNVGTAIVNCAHPASQVLVRSAGCFLSSPALVKSAGTARWIGGDLPL